MAILFSTLDSYSQKDRDMIFVEMYAIKYDSTYNFQADTAFLKREGLYISFTPNTIYNLDALATFKLSYIDWEKDSSLSCEQVLHNLRAMVRTHYSDGTKDIYLVGANGIGTIKNNDVYKSDNYFLELIYHYFPKYHYQNK